MKIAAILRRSAAVMALLLATQAAASAQTVDTAEDPGNAAGAETVRMISPDIVISQVYGGGGNTGAPYTHDFIELFNRGGAPVSINGWSVQYASATGNTWTNRTNISGILQPGQYYLIQEAQGTGGAQPLPTPDAIGIIAMAAGSGKVALVTNQINLSCGTSCTNDPSVRDFVGYGTANNFEGAGAAPLLTNTTAALRGGGGCTDTDTNSADFTAIAPIPRNTFSPIAPCGGPTVPTGVAAANPASVPGIFT